MVKRLSNKKYQKKKILRNHSFKQNVFISFVCIAVIIGVIYGGKYAYGKYYAARYNKGIAIASNLYFSSDKLVKSKGYANIDDIADDSESIKNINIFSNTSSWSSSDVPLTFDIRNYDNNILYNEDKLDIGYKVEFYLLDEPVGAEYRIEYLDNSGNESKIQLKAKGDKAVVEGKTIGGSLDANTYEINVKLTGPTKDYSAARVLVMAYPVSPDFVHRDENEEQENRLLGIFQAQPTDMQIIIEDEGFEVEDEADYNDTKWKAKVEDLSGYIYNFKTAGDVVIDTNTATKQLAEITWNNKILKIDKYNDNYERAVAHGDGLTDDAEKYITTNGDLTTMKIEVLPYMSINITFYKGDDFNTVFSTQPATAAGRAWFENLVDVKMLQ